VEAVNALARGGGNNAPRLSHKRDDHVRQLARHEITNLLEEGYVEIGAFGPVSVSLG
jgi:hypothetical protein